MQRKCLTCGIEFAGRPDSTKCPGCVKKAKSSTYRTRTCTQCGSKFRGGPAALYCPPCRAEIIRARDRAYHQKGSKRPLGSTDVCQWCGRTYIVESPRQKYCCSECSQTAVKEKDRQKARNWYNSHSDPIAKKERIKASTADRFCVVCGKRIERVGQAITCSPECSLVHRNHLTSEWGKKHRVERATYRRNQRKLEKSNSDDSKKLDD